MIALAEREVILPRGIVSGGRVERRAALRAVTGRDEEFLLVDAPAMLPADRNTALLARCVTSFGGRNRASTDDVRDLCLGDREALLMHLCAATTGRQVSGVIDCRGSDCVEKLDVNLDVMDMLIDPYEDVDESYEARLERDGGTFLIRFRLPTGRHQERAARLVVGGTGTPERYIADAVVDDVSKDGVPLESIPDDLLDEFASVLEALDPQAELRLSITCPACEAAFTVLFDPGEFLYRDVIGRRTGFYGEVHTLAFNYHWTEGDILELPVERRRLYLTLIADDLSERVQT